ncbi:MAG: hypothetical protein FWC78_07420 [Defluviitaleaceae bacterium]|nr:hypothetical protein [Defluviitaleaceae bacterium]
MSKKLLAPIIILLLLAVSACGGGREITPPETARRTPVERPGQDTYTPTPTPLPEIFRAPTETLRILAPAHFSAVIREAARLGNIDIQLTSFNPETQTDYWTANLARLLGTADAFDIFFADPRMPMRHFARSGHLADIFELMDDCRNFDRSDFYMQPLHALTIDGGLYFFPLNFGFQFVSVNSMLPGFLVHQFENMTSITVSEMFDMFLAARSDEAWAGDFSFMSLANCRNMTIPGFVVLNAMSSFVDFNAGVSHLDSQEFLTLLQTLNGLVDENIEIGDEIIAAISADANVRYNSTRNGQWDPLVTTGARYVVNPTAHGFKSFMYAFSVLNEFAAPVAAVIPLYEPNIEGNLLTVNFNHYIPLVDERGRLITNMGTTYPSNLISIIAGPNEALAWDFVTQYLIPASLCATTTYAAVPITSLWWGRPSMGPHTFDLPIIREHTHQHLTGAINQVAQTSWEELFFYMDDDDNFSSSSRMIWGGIPLTGIYNADSNTATETINAAITQMESLASMPISPLPIIPFELFEPAIINMIRGMITPEEAARGIHTNVSMWLGE